MTVVKAGRLERMHRVRGIERALGSKSRKQQSRFRKEKARITFLAHARNFQHMEVCFPVSYPLYLSLLLHTQLNFLVLLNQLFLLITMFRTSADSRLFVYHYYFFNTISGDRL